MKIKLLTAIGFISFVAACAPQLETAKPIDVKYSSQSARKVFGFHPTTVRTSQKVPGSQNAELTGVPCSLKGSGFSVQFQTPAVVNVPVYGISSRVIQINCQFNGVEKSENANPVNLTESKAISAGTGGGLIGALIVAGAMSARKDRNTDQYGYKSVSILFDKK